jgi:hypothetical protein
MLAHLPLDVTPAAVADLAATARRSTVYTLTRDGEWWLHHCHDDAAQRRTLWQVWHGSELLASRHSLFQALTEAAAQ